MRQTIAALVVVAAVFASGATHAVEIERGARTDVTRVSANDASRFRVWVKLGGTLGLASRYDVPPEQGSSIWTTHGYATSPPRNEGVAATGYISGTDVYEFVYYIGADRNLYQGRILNAGSIGWTMIGSPGGVLTGHIAAGTFISGGHRYLMVSATTIGAQLYRWVKDVSLSSGTWTFADTGWSVVDPLVITTNPAETVASTFGSSNETTQNLKLHRWTGSAWTTSNLGHPSTNSVCDSIAASQSPVGLGDELYRVVVACTAKSGSANLYLATANSETSTSFTWASHALAAAVPTDLGQVVASTVRPWLLTKVLDVHLITELGLYRAAISTGAANVSLSGGVAEGGTPVGGLSTVPGGFLTSRIFYPVDMRDSHYLSEKLGTAGPADVWNYRAYGAGAPLKLWASSSRYAEGVAATNDGIFSLTLMDRPDAGFPSVTAWFSRTDGQTALSSVLTKVVAGITYTYVGDPTTGVTDSGRAYYVMLGNNYSTCSSSAATTDSTVWLTSTIDGASFTTPVVVHTRHGPPSSSTRIDHPYADIENIVGAPDRLHIVFWDVSDDRIYYRGFDESTGLLPIVDLLVPVGAPPRLTASNNGRVIVYSGSGSSVRYCELNAARTGCLGGWATVPGLTVAASSNVPVPPLDRIRTSQPYSIAYSQTQDRMFLCAQVLESDGADFDVRCMRGTRNASNTYDWTALFAVGPVDDDADQFLPEVGVAADNAMANANGTVMITYYDRSVTLGNYYYKSRKLMSFDAMGTFTSPVDAYVGQLLNDPIWLPTHCRDGSKFIGDYSGFRADELHAQPFYVETEPGGPGTRIKTDFMSLGSWLP